MEGEAFFCSERAFASALTINALAPPVVIVGRSTTAGSPNAGKASEPASRMQQGIFSRSLMSGILVQRSLAATIQKGGPCLSIFMIEDGFFRSLSHGATAAMLTGIKPLDGQRYVNHFTQRTTREGWTGRPRCNYQSGRSRPRNRTCGSRTSPGRARRENI